MSYLGLWSPCFPSINERYVHIEEIEVVGLLGRDGSIKMSFHKDINIVTGRNGAGKTSLLKLVWYIMSGNILIALREVPFKSIYIKTDLYACTVERTGNVTCRVEFEADGESYLFADQFDEDGVFVGNAEDEANPELYSRGSSVFFPTFRRIEGGFTLTTTSNRRRTASAGFGSKPKSEIEESLVQLSRTLTNSKHTFVAAISTGDIVSILLNKYADLSSEYNAIQRSKSEEIIKTIKSYKYKPNQVDELGAANRTLDQIRAEIELMESQRSTVMAPLEAVRSVVESLFRHVGISIGARLSFGDAANAVNSDQLSAGEKQMLSFICYNAFNTNSVVFIDEPELSLHVDWQRQIFPILLGQLSSNQFVITTHSPFIYSKYQDKEIQLVSDRGDELV